ncbi:hypothetical protein UFOVP4_42 [uncultured Caudovirales phage]|uniref:Uncharacterized protein n=1 Tax=uncultured Caudovirales phage TaxID=2100421 RepID=A0A6J7VKP0_9CAUD|nr:hypothetical protein UFOVP4_42 [uncultured Caudovirales phage]CAB4241257.1 hypothetical protein UFOVP64_18 [uncultured Caudovirales phage]CAB5078991.1 hypothetical protein UFOVP145_32 [uncultured Caudovirales phage]
MRVPVVIPARSHGSAGTVPGVLWEWPGTVGIGRER